MDRDFSDILSALSVEGADYLLVDFEEAWPRRATTEIDGLAVPVIGRADLIRNKRATGRPRDRADADQIENPD